MKLSRITIFRINEQEAVVRNFRTTAMDGKEYKSLKEAEKSIEQANNKWGAGSD